MIYISKRKKIFLSLFDALCKPIFVLTIIKNTFRKRDTSGLAPKKILLMELWGIGDIVLMIPAMTAIRQRFPDAEITLLAKARAREVLKENPLVDKFITFDLPWTRFHGKYRLWQWNFKQLLRLIKRLREASFDLALDARMDVRNNFLMYLIGAKRRVGYAYTGGSHFLTDVVDIDYTKQHRSDEWARLLEYIQIPIEMRTPRIWISEQEKSWADDFFAQHNIVLQDLIIGIHPGGSIKKRCWPLERFAKIAQYTRDTYNAQIIIFCEPDGFGEDIQIAGKSVRVKPTLRQLICLLSKLDLFICNDSGPMHLATAVNTELIAIFGPGILEAIGPCGEKQSIVRKENVTCRPCRDYCKHEEPFCITDIAVDQVKKTVDSVLQKIEK